MHAVDEAVHAARRQVDEVRLNPYPGMRALLWQRLTGVGITLYLFAHMAVIGSIARGPDAFDRMLRRVTEPSWVIAPLEFVLILVIAFHALNGIRVTVLEFGSLAKHHRASVLVMVVTLAMLVVLGGTVFFARLLGA
jgi:succinate dehydrogenase / fumarate reductase, cytochrome b subunit